MEDVLLEEITRYTNKPPESSLWLPDSSPLVWRSKTANRLTLNCRKRPDSPEVSEGCCILLPFAFDSKNKHAHRPCGRRIQALSGSWYEGCCLSNRRRFGLCFNAETLNPGNVTKSPSGTSFPVPRGMAHISSH